jgi:hypothetical protein
MYKKKDEGLPSKYQQVEYIQSTGTQYINTEVYGTEHTDFDLEFQFTSVNKAWQQLFAGDLNSGYSPKLYTQNTYLSQLAIYSGVNNYIIYNIDTSIKHILEVSGQSIYLDGVKKLTVARKTGTSELPYWIFNSASEPTLYANMRLYKLTMYENNVKIREFIPCYRKSDTEIGLYDLVEKIFYTNDGSGTFVKGADV